MADLSAQILKQVEFYFSNSNMPRDKFLLEHTGKNEGWAEIAILASFAKMKKLTTDLAVVAAALRESKELLEVNEEGTKVKRKTPVPESVDNIKNAIYAKGFPTDFEIEKINEFLTPSLQETEKILATRMRRFEDRTFKGSVFIEFDSAATAERVSKLELKVGEEALVIRMKGEYLNEKKEQRNAKKKGDDKGEKRKRDDGEDGDEVKVEEKEFKRDIIPNSIIQVDKVGDLCTREALKEAVEASGAQVAFVEFNKGNAKGYVRLHKDTTMGAKEAVDKMKADEVKIADTVCELSVLEGEEETAYWGKLFDLQENKQKGRSGKGGKGGKGRSGKGGKGGKGKGGKGSNKRQKE